jgi:hypothetical protein
VCIYREDETMSDEEHNKIENAEHQVNALTKRPDPAWVRGRCPLCGDDVVSNLYYYGGKGYLVRWECWSSLAEPATCGYRKDL